MKETQAVAGGTGKSAQAQVAKEAANVQSGILKTVEQGRQAFVKSQVEATEKGVAATIASTKATVEVERQANNVRLGFLRTAELGRQEFVGSQIKAAEAEAKGIVGAVQKEASERQRIAQEINQAFQAREAERLVFQSRTLKQAEAAWASSEKTKLSSTREAEREGERLLAATNQARAKAASETQAAAAKIAQAAQAGSTKFDSAAFWARQGKAATDASRTTVHESVAAAKASSLIWDKATLDRIRAAEQAEAREAQVVAKRVATATRATSTVIRDAKTGATLTQAELAKIISGGSKVVESEAGKIGKFTGGILTDLQKLFLQNNFLFRQIGQRAAGDLGFAAVGVGKLALNFQSLVSRQLSAAASQELLNKAFQKFQGVVASVASGRSKAASDLFALFKVDPLAALRSPEQAFAKFLAGFRGITNEADRAAFAVSVFGKDAIKLLPALEGAAGGMEEVIGGASGLLGVLGPVGIAVGVVAAALASAAALSIGAAAGMYYFAKSVSDTEERFADLNRQTGLSVGNLETLEIGTKSAGTTLERLNTSVGQLERKLIDASEGGTSRLSVGLKKLGIDAEDPNKALSQLIDLLAKLPAGTVRTGAAMQIFGRGGKDVAGVVGEIVDQVGNTDGALERFKQHLIDAGVHINTDGVETASNFHKQLVLLEAQIESVKRVIGEEALPTVLDAATKFSNWIGRNKTEIADWAKAIEHAAEMLANLGGILLKLTGLSLLIPVTIQLRIAKAFKTPSGDLTTDIAELVGKSISSKPQPGLEKGSLIADELAKVKANADKITANVTEKLIQNSFKPKGKGGGGKGEDPAQTARRLAEISLQETLKGLQAEHDALERQLNLNLTSRNQYTQDAINLELKRRDATIKGLQDELAAAEKIRKPGQRAIRVAEINTRIKEEERRSAKEVQQITDDSAAEQLRIGQATAQSQLRIIETQTDQVKARIRELADFRIVTEQQAAEFEQNQTLRVFNARERILQQELREAGDNAEKRNEARNKLNELDAERKAFIESSSRSIAAAIRSDAEHVVQFVAQIRDAFQRAADTRLQAGEMNLEPLRNSILTRHELWDAELQFEITREEQRHRTVFRQLEDEGRLARIRIKNENELAAVLRGIRAQAEAEEALHQARLQQLATQAAEQRRQELLQVADDLSSIASDIFDAIGKSSDEFWRSLKQTVSSFAKQIRDELFKGLLERAITGQAQGAEGLIGMIINPLLKATGPNAHIADNTKATEANTAALNALTGAMGGTPAISGGLSGALQLIPGLFGGGRASGGPVSAGKVYQIHDNEFFRPNISGQILNLNQAQGLLNNQRDEVRLNVAVGQDAVDDLVESHMRTPKGRRAALVQAKYNRKVGKLLFA